MKLGIRELRERIARLRREDRARCRGCGYDCGSIPSESHCPECGNPDPSAPTNIWRDGRFHLGWIMLWSQGPMALWLVLGSIPAGPVVRGVKSTPLLISLYTDAFGLFGNNRASLVVTVIVIGSPLLLMIAGGFVTQWGCRRHRSMPLRMMILCLPIGIALVIRSFFAV